MSAMGRPRRKFAESCKVRFLRFADLGAKRSEGPVYAIGVDAAVPKPIFSRLQRKLTLSRMTDHRGGVYQWPVVRVMLISAGWLIA